MESEDEVLELRVQEIEAEFVLLHFLERPIRRPAICRDPVSRRHDSRPVPAAHAVNIDRLFCRIVHNPEKLGELPLGRRPMHRHRNVHVVHAGLAGQGGLIWLSIVARQIDDRLDTEGREIGVVAPFGLRAAVVMVVDTSEVIDANVRGGGDRRVRTCTRADDGGNGQR